MIFFDTETVGFHGFVVLIQWAEDDGPIELYDVWKNPVSETLRLIDMIAESDVCGFNLAFDWFHLSKCYNTFCNLPPDLIPEDDIDAVALAEAKSRTTICIKPKRACDLMLHARKGPYQSLMDRKDVRIRRIPSALAQPLANELNQRVKLDDIYFARRKDKMAPQWKVMDIIKGKVTDQHFKDIVLKFAAKGGLKNLAMHALKVDADSILKLDDIGVDPAFHPDEVGWAPFARFHGKPGKWKSSWPDMVKFHIKYWAYNPLGRKYAENDVVYTRGLYKYFDSPEPGDTDSELACMVGACRWHGFAIDIEKMKTQRAAARDVSLTAPKDPRRVLAWLYEVLDDTEKLGMVDHQGKPSTKKILLENVSMWNIDGSLADREQGNHPAAKRATLVLRARKAAKEVELFDKLIKAKRFHASFVVIGTLSSRMAGSDGLNPQGIKRTQDVRSCFTLADPGYSLCGGDFDAFEVVLADAVYDDERLRADLQSGKKIHALFAMELFPGKTYEEILASKGKDPDYYTYGKNGVFAMVYGGDENTLVIKIGVAEDVALKTMNGFQDRYTGIRRSRKRIYDMFCSMRQPNGIGTKVVWNQPADYVESFLGFKRYFTLENEICRVLFELAQHPPSNWKHFKIKVVRRDREQTAMGAAQSALYGAAFQIQARNMRAAANHEIQNPGALITKSVQRAVWDVQPSGANDWRVVPFNAHDEVMVPTRPAYVNDVRDAVMKTVESFRPRVPLIKMEWKLSLESWASK